MIYLDNAATTATRREVLEAMWPYLTGAYGNPSSHHGVGEPAAQALGDARRTIATFLGCRAGEVVFTAGGTEADNLAVKGIALARPAGRHVVTTQIEHPAVAACCDHLESAYGFEVTRLGVDRTGRVAPDAVANALRDDTTLISVMAANNEIGTLEPIEAIADIARERGVPFHTDAVQAAGAIDLSGLRADAVSISGHKLGAPKGVGALRVRGGLALQPVIHGGGQERDRRSGTENVAGAVGLAAAVSRCTLDHDLMCAARDAFVAEVLEGCPGAFLTGHPTDRLPGHASFCFPGVAGEGVLVRLEQEHALVCSSGSACAAGSDDPSPVLLALGIAPEVAQTAVRFTAAGPSDFDGVGAAVVEAVGAMRGLGSSPATCG